MSTRELGEALMYGAAGGTAALVIGGVTNNWIAWTTTGTVLLIGAVLWSWHDAREEDRTQELDARSEQILAVLLDTRNKASQVSSPKELANTYAYALEDISVIVQLPATGGEVQPEPQQRTN